jgi:hypothetical protein
MLFVRDNPTGIDVPIDVLTKRFYSGLLQYLELEDKDVLFVGRTDKNPRENGFVPEIYRNGRYEDVAFDDKRSLTCFWGIPDTQSFIKDPNAIDMRPYVIFAVNITKTKITDDERIRQLVLSMCSYSGIDINSISIGSDQTFKEYKKLNLKYRNMNPFRVFRIDFKTYIKPATNPQSYVNNCKQTKLQ